MENLNVSSWRKYEIIFVTGSILLVRTFVFYQWLSTVFLLRVCGTQVKHAMRLDDNAVLRPSGLLDGLLVLPLTFSSNVCIFYHGDPSIRWYYVHTIISAGDIKACPRCHTYIVKMDDGSCNHMVCAMCSVEFCWLCLKEISDLHYLR